MCYSLLRRLIQAEINLYGYHADYAHGRELVGWHKIVAGLGLPHLQADCYLTPLYNFVLPNLRRVHIHSVLPRHLYPKWPI